MAGKKIPIVALPEGTVTLLLADIEGSTKAWETAPEQMRAALAHHDRVVAEALDRHAGVRPRDQGEGDAFLAAFSRATAALACALEIQRGLAGGSLRLRIALHTGEIQLRDEFNYIGPTINRAARFRNAAHGGQTVLSQATYELVSSGVDNAVTFQDLGHHRFKDLTKPERVWQLCHADLTTQFPPLRSLDPVPNNLPVQLTSFVGRDTEVAELCRAIAAHRLVSLIGAGGCGKTRLAAHVAAEITERYPDGSWWIELAPITNPDLVPYAMVRALGLKEEAGRSLLDTLGGQLSHLNALVVLDNCEHLLEACAQLVVHLLQVAPNRRIVTTSREALGVAGEVPWQVPSLDDETATRLFVERAAQLRGGFTPDGATLDVIRGICRRLDGIPLAIELAAARMRMLSPAHIAAALDDRFRLLTGGGRGVMPRQQTLETSVAWSYDLLDEAERLLLCRLSVFAGGFSFDAAERVGAGALIEPRAVMDLLAHLIDKSLVQADAVHTGERYRLLETIRMFARDRLVESGEANTTRARHCDYFVALSETAEPALALADGPLWLARLEAEHDNLRAALEWADANGQVEWQLRMLGALTLFFELRAHLGEGGRWFARALGADGAPSSIRARALWGAAHVAGYGGDFVTASTRAAQALAMAEELGDDRVRARALNHIGFVQMWSEPGLALEEFKVSVQLGRQTGDHWRWPMA